MLINSRSGSDLHTATLEQVLVTAELASRPSRAPDYAAEAAALAALAEALAGSPQDVLQKLAHIIIELCEADSAGVSFLEPGGQHGMVRWVAVAGRLARNVENSMPRDASPCGAAMERDGILLFDRPGRRFLDLATLEPTIMEDLAVPFHVDGKPIGTVWALGHTSTKAFDAEDARLLKSLSRFGAAAYRLMSERSELERRVQERATELARAEAALRDSESQVADLESIRRLYDLHAKLAVETDLQAALDSILAVAIDFAGTDRGCIQLPSADGWRMEMVAHCGYGPDSPFTSHFRSSGSKLGCETSKRERKRILIEDLEHFGPLLGTVDREVGLSDGIRAAQSTPMVTTAGEVVGILSTQYRQPHRPSAEQLRLIDLVAWTAGNFIERHRAHAALRVSEDRSRRAMAIETVGILFFNLDGRMVDANPAFERMSGYAADELRQITDWAQLTPPEFIALTGEHAAELAEHGATAAYEKQMIRKDGSRWWGLFAPTRLAGSGRDAECVEFIIDITAAKETEQALRDAEGRWATVFAQTAVGLAEIQSDGRFLRVNDMLCQLFGRPSETLLGMSALDVTHPDDRAATEAVVGRVLSTGERLSIDKRYVRSDGTVLYGTSTVTRLDGAAGGPATVLAVFVDLTARQQIEEQRGRLLEQEKLARLHAERAMTTRDEFLAVVSHELRTPLSAILIYSQLLRGWAGDASPEHREAIDAITTSAQAQRQLIDDLLDTSRISTGQMRLEARPTQLTALVRAGVDAVRATAESKGVAIVAEVGVADVGTVHVDPDRLQQVIWNLLANAIKFTPAGGRVDVALSRQGREVELRVTDTGQGIEPEFLPHMFDPFRQADGSTTRSHGGLGLGLAICKQLVEQHGGTITAESAGVGRGATFIVRMPLPAVTSHPLGGADAAPIAAALPVEM